MGTSKKHTAGFTLAELLLTVAIVLALAAIAIPSIITAQNNMRMLELDNAAEAIANAAQTQMTAKKVSGTWLDLIEEGDGFKAEYPEAKAPSGTGQSLRYMTADTARSNGIVPSLSVDDQVRASDYVIEFDAATASITRVFYSDGKDGFFAAPGPTIKAAQTYYEAGGSDNQADRMNNSPMIGCYTGTPSGATNEVALKNPVISVDEKSGCLWVNDKNLEKKSDGTIIANTNTTVTIESESGGRAFQISSLSYGTTTLSVSLPDQESSTLAISDLKGLFKQVYADGADGGTIYSIDLNALMLSIKDKYPASSVNTVLQSYSAGEQLVAVAEVNHTSKPSVPAHARAHIEWPASVGKLALLVTSPYSANVEAALGNKTTTVDSSQYAGPTVTASSINGGPAFGIDMVDLLEDTDNYLKKGSVNEALSKENAQAGYQSYKGGWVPASQVRNDETFRFKATVGSYGKHAYQVAEVWLKLQRGDAIEATRVGYLENNRWVWAQFVQEGVRYDYRGLDNCFSWYDANNSLIAVAEEGTERVSSITLNAQAYYQFSSENHSYGLETEDGAATVYLRTIPKNSEVQLYFQQLAKDKKLVSTYLSSDAEESTARTNWVASKEARKAFEAEFGASSSDVSWLVTRASAAGFDEGSAYLKDQQNVRVYYSIAPGLGFDNIRTFNGNNLTNVRSTGMTNISLWSFRGPSYDGLVSMPNAMLQVDAADRYTLVSKNNCDFKLSNMKDYQFYRVLSYYRMVNEELKKTDLADQFVPHIHMNDADVAALQVLPDEEDEDYKYLFKGWTAQDGAVFCSAGEAIGLYDGALNRRGTKLTAVIDEVKKPKFTLGLMYLEFDDFSNVVGWYGYSDYRNGDKEKNLPTQSKISDWGYYLVVPPDVEKSDMWLEGINGGMIDSPVVLTIGSEQFNAYRITLKGDGLYAIQYLPVNIEIKKTELKATFYINCNFARAVTMDKGEAATWGTSKSPWSVRHAAQFPGSLKNNNGLSGPNGAYSIQSVFMHDHFVQEHNLDMAQAQQYFPSYGVKFNQVFSGTYSGKDAENNQFQIENAYRYCMDRDGKGYYSANHGQGLFPEVSGAELDDIQLVVRGNQKVESAVGQGTFGLLVGLATNLNMHRCSVTGQPDDQGIGPSLVFNANNKNYSAFGSLIGSAQNVNVYHAAVYGFKFVIKTSDSDVWGDVPKIGGCVGLARNTVLYACSIKNMAFDVPNAIFQYKEGLYFGGFIGWGNSSNVYPSGRDNPEIEDVSASFSGDMISEKLYVGSIIGRNEFACQSSGCTPVRMYYARGNASLVPFDTILVGRS